MSVGVLLLLVLVVRGPRLLVRRLWRRSLVCRLLGRIISGLLGCIVGRLLRRVVGWLLRLRPVVAGLRRLRSRLVGLWLLLGRTVGRFGGVVCLLRRFVGRFSWLGRLISGFSGLVCGLGGLVGGLGRLVGGLLRCRLFVAWLRGGLGSTVCLFLWRGRLVGGLGCGGTRRVDHVDRRGVVGLVDEDWELVVRQRYVLDGGRRVGAAFAATVAAVIMLGNLQIKRDFIANKLIITKMDYFSRSIYIFLS